MSGAKPLRAQFVASASVGRESGRILVRDGSALIECAPGSMFLVRIGWAVSRRIEVGMAFSATLDRKTSSGEFSDEVSYWVANPLIRAVVVGGGSSKRGLYLSSGPALTRTSFSLNSLAALDGISSWGPGWRFGLELLPVRVSNRLNV